MSHIHLYRTWPPKTQRDWVGCLKRSDVPDLEVGDTVEYKGVVYGALPCWKGDALVVQLDHAGRAQVATPLPKENDDAELKELVGAGAGSGSIPDSRWPGAV